MYTPIGLGEVARSAGMVPGLVVAGTVATAYVRMRARDRVPSSA